jgi:hypothetical protein
MPNVGTCRSENDRGLSFAADSSDLLLTLAAPAVRIGADMHDRGAVRTPRRA